VITTIGAATMIILERSSSTCSTSGCSSSPGTVVIAFYRAFIVYKHGEEKNPIGDFEKPIEIHYIHNIHENPTVIIIKY
jgi:hypothetical protein